MKSKWMRVYESAKKPRPLRGTLLLKLRKASARRMGKWRAVLWLVLWPVLWPVIKYCRATNRPQQEATFSMPNKKCYLYSCCTIFTNCSNIQINKQLMLQQMQLRVLQRIQGKGSNAWRAELSEVLHKVPAQSHTPRVGQWEHTTTILHFSTVITFTLKSTMCQFYGGRNWLVKISRHMLFQR